MNYTILIVLNSVRICTQKAALVLGACLGLLLFSSPVFGQLNYGRVYGSVSDQTGGAIADAAVTVTDVARGTNRVLTSDASGAYNAPSLLPGTYTVRVEAKGFSTVDRQNVLVEVGQEVRVDVTLRPGEQNQTVTVTESVPLINTTNAQLGGVLENQALGDLPLNGREFQKLLIFQPGVKANGLDIYVNGMRADNNMWLLDGVDNYNLTSSSGPVAGGQSSFDQATILPLDAIQEINVVQNPKAEYGWKVGGQVNVGLKSGTNSIHGTATAFGRDAVLDARNPFATSRGDDQLEQFGATVGGPIKKDKLFYFAAYEGQRYTIGSPRIAQIPTSLPGAGTANSFPDAIADIKKVLANNPAAKNAATGAPLAISALSLNMAGCTLGPPVSCNASAGLFPNSTSTQSVPVLIDNVGGSDSGVGKLDYHYNDHNSFNGEYFRGEGGVSRAPSAVTPFWRAKNFTVGTVARAVWVWTPNSTWLNELRVGYEGQQSPQGPSECGDPSSAAPNYAQAFGFVTGLNLTPPQCGFPVFQVSGFDNLGGGNTQLATWWTQSYVDTVSYTHGNHQIKFGGETHLSHFTGLPGSVSGILGSISFGTSVNAFSGATALENFLTGTVGSASVIAGNPTRHVTYDRYAGFIQDDWRITPRVVVGYGLRWEYVAPISERNDLLGKFAPSAPFGLVQQGKQVNQLYSNSKDDFAPRLGVAWDIRGNGKTVVRAGGTIVYNSDQSLKVFMNTANAALGFAPTASALINPNGTTAAAAGTNGNIATGTLSLNNVPWAVNTPIFGAAFGASAPPCGNGVGANPAPCAIGTIDPNYRRAYVTTWTLAVERALTNAISLNVIYVGDRGTHLGANVNLNQPIGPAQNKATNSEQTERPYYTQFPYFGNILDYTSFGVSNYNALQLKLTARSAHGFNFSLGYSYSHSLDMTSAETGYTALEATEVFRDYANSNQDPFHTFSATISSQIPGRKSPGQLLQGWQVNTVVHVLAGTPFSAYDTSSDLAGNGASTLWTLAGNPADFKAGTIAPIPCWGVVGSSFAKANNCTPVSAIANMPAACVTAATNEATNPNVPASDKNSTGLKALANFGCYASGNSVIVPPAQGTFGTMSRTTLRAAPFKEWDMSVSKSWKIQERYTVQFRAEAFNVVNSTQFASPSTDPNKPATFGVSASTPNSSSPVVGEGGPRQIQFGLKLTF